MNDTSLQIDNRAPATVRVIVSVGRTVTTGLPFRVVEVTTGGVTKFVREPVKVEKSDFSEGEEVELPAAEAHRLAALGFVYFPDAAPAFSRPLGVAHAGAQPVVERPSPEGPTSQQDGHDPDDDLGRPIGITQSEPRARAAR